MSVQELQDTQELSATAYFDILKCLVYTGAYSLSTQGYLTKLRRAFGITTEQHKDWHKALEASVKSQAFDFERTPAAPAPAPAAAAAAHESGAAAAAAPPLQEAPAPQQPLAAAATGTQPAPQAAHPSTASRAAAPAAAAAAAAPQTEAPATEPEGGGGGGGEGPSGLDKARKLKRVAPQDDPLSYLGTQVQRLWYGKWVVGVVTDWKADTGQHCLTYDLGKRNETYESLTLEDSTETKIMETKVDLALYPKSIAVKTSAQLANLAAGRGPANRSKRRISTGASDDDDDDDNDD